MTAARHPTPSIWALLLAGTVAAIWPARAQSIIRDTAFHTWNRPSNADSTRLGYKGYGYGSDAYNTPVTVLLNKGFDIFQLRNHPRNVWTFPYGTAYHFGVRGVWQYPGTAVDRFGGWGRMARVELLPFSFKSDQMNWFANYTEHLLGGGMTMRGLEEWYRDNDTPYPIVAAILTTYAASAMNELTEQGNGLGEPYKDTSAGGVADLDIFDVAAVVLFHWKQPAYFLSHTLQAADWSNQASLTFPNKQLQNNGQYFSLKIPIGLERTRIFVRGGMGAQIGISRRLADGEHHASVGLGGDTSVRDIDASGHETVHFGAGAGFYYDRNNSLLWSLTSSPAENVAALNIYPGVVNGLPRELGLWAIYTRHNQLRFGIVHTRALGLGLGFGK